MFNIINSNSYNFKPQQSLKRTLTPQSKLSSQPSCDSVNFSGRYISLEDFPLKAISDIPCPYCKGTVYTYEDILKFGKDMTHAKGEALQKGLAEKMTNQKLTTEKNIALDLIEQAKNNPNLTIEDFFKKMAPNSEKRLITKQNEILTRTKESLQKISKPTKEKINTDFKIIQSGVKKSSEVANSKRKGLIDGFVKLLKIEENSQNKEILATTINILRELPTSAKDNDAFIVKHKNRTSREIAAELLTPYSTTADHLKAFIHDGQSSVENLAVAHKSCNETKSMTSLSLLKVNYFQDYFNVVAKKLKENIIEGMEDYIPEAAKTIEEESNSKIKIKLPNEL